MIKNKKDLIKKNQKTNQKNHFKNFQEYKKERE